jgi:hypothetical protein
MADIFISYARKDRSRVEPLAKALEKSGWSVWWDRTIPPGKTFDQAIEEAISAAKCVVVLWSQNSIKSDWVKEEAGIGKQRSILIPAKIDAVEPPLGFGYIQAADLTDWQSQLSHTGLNGLLKAIESILNPVSMELKKEEQGQQRVESQGKAKDEAPRLNQVKLDVIIDSLGAQLLYLPTYRRIEQELNLIFKGLDDRELKSRRRMLASRRNTDNYIELVEFGMKDVEFDIKNTQDELDKFARENLNNLTFSYLGDIVEQKYQSVDLLPIKEADPKTI